MATLTATRAEANYPVTKGTYGNLRCAWGTIELTSNNAANTIVQLCRVPKGATVVGGYIMAADLETGSDELDIDFGWEANGNEVADPDGFGNFAAANWTGAAVTGLIPVAGNWKPLQGVLLTAGPKTFAAETVIAATIIVDAHTGGTGQISVVVFYTVD